MLLVSYKTKLLFIGMVAMIFYLIRFSVINLYFKDDCYEDNGCNFDMVCEFICLDRSICVSFLLFFFSETNWQEVCPTHINIGGCPVDCYQPYYLFLITSSH
jgi:hypothetical protein